VHVTLIELLRCPADHPDTPLIATVDRRDGRYVAHGSLGCPACGMRFPIRDFIADFGAGEGAAEDSPPSAAAVRPDDAGVDRLAAMLDARRPGAFHLLAGTWGHAAAGLALSYDVQAIAVNPPAGVRPAEGVSVILAPRRVPLAEHSVYGAAIDAAWAGESTGFTGCVQAVKPGGRVVAPSAHPVPPDVRELVRDAEWWVGERAPAAVEPVPLTRATR
jgi:uncharacterized protein YbaR (Trm112 family)